MKRELNSIIDAHAHSFSGACLIRGRTQTLVSRAHGLANRDFNVPNRMDTRFDTASVTKLYTAVATLQLIEREVLSLTDKIHEILDLEGTTIPRDVKIEQLLNHTSGIADDADEEAGEDYSALFIDRPNYAIRNCADFLPQFAHKEPVFPAGTDVRYNNCAFVLLGLVIEKKTQTDYRSYVKSHIFKPAGLNETFFGAKDEVCPNTAEGYFAVGGNAGEGTTWRKNIYSYPPIGTPDGGALTNVGDLDAFIRALRGGILLSPSYTDMLFMPHCPFSRQVKYGTWRTGYAFEFIESDGATFCMYKEGGNPGVDAIVSYYPELDITLSMLSNQEGPFYNIYHELQDVLYARYRRVRRGEYPAASQ